MRITAFLGSPRRKGHTAGLVDRVRQALTADHHDVEMVHLARLRISPCQECFACQKIRNQPGCAQDDDMQQLYRTIEDSDAIILACPVFCWSFPAQLKSFLDRMYCLVKFSSDGTYAALLEKAGRVADAKHIYEEILRRTKRAPGHYRRAEREWTTAARRALQRLEHPS